MSNEDLLSKIDLRYRHLLLELKQAFIHKSHDKDYNQFYDDDILYSKNIDDKLEDLMPEENEGEELIHSKIEDVIASLKEARKVLFE